MGVEEAVQRRDKPTQGASPLSGSPISFCAIDFAVSVCHCGALLPSCGLNSRDGSRSARPNVKTRGSASACSSIAYNQARDTRQTASGYCGFHSQLVFVSLSTSMHKQRTSSCSVLFLIFVFLLFFVLLRDGWLCCRCRRCCVVSCNGVTREL